jgi:hypothetical protein
MKQLQKMFFTLGLTASLIVGGQMILPSLATAQTNACTELENKIKKGGFDTSTLPRYCSTESLFGKFLNQALYAIGIAAVVAIIYGGYLYITSGANEEQRKKGRTVLTWAIIGLVVVIFAIVIVNVVVRAVTQ